MDDCNSLPGELVTEESISVCKRGLHVFLGGRLYDFESTTGPLGY